MEEIEVNDPAAEISRTELFGSYDDEHASRGVDQYSKLLSDLKFASEITDSACGEYRDAVGKARMVYRHAIEQARETLDAHIAGVLAEVKKSGKL